MRQLHIFPPLFQNSIWRNVLFSALISLGLSNKLLVKHLARNGFAKAFFLIGENNLTVLKLWISATAVRRNK